LIEKPFREKSSLGMGLLRRNRIKFRWVIYQGLQLDQFHTNGSPLSRTVEWVGGRTLCIARGRMGTHATTLNRKGDRCDQMIETLVFVSTHYSIGEP
jgi:hypothetical protein